jgi:hypothetical protein
MKEVNQNVVHASVTIEQTDNMGRHGPFVKVFREMDNDNKVTDWYTPDYALGFADELRRAAMSA